MVELSEEQVESARNALAEFETHDPSEERLHGLFKELLDIMVETRRAALQAFHKVEQLEKKGGSRARGKAELQLTQSPYLGVWFGTRPTTRHLRITVVEECSKDGKKAVRVIREGKSRVILLSSLIYSYDPVNPPLPQLKGRTP